MTTAAPTVPAPVNAPTNAPAKAPAVSESAGLLDLGVALGNPVWTWVLAFGVVGAGYVALRVLRSVAASRLQRLAERTPRTWDDALVRVVRSIRVWLLMPTVVFAASTLLYLPDPLPRALKIAAVLGLAAQLIVSASRLVDLTLGLAVGRLRQEDGSADPTLMSGMGVLRFIALAVLVIVVALLALDNLGVAITPLITGLGIGGIAIALAVQNILSDLFSSVTIILDKPFVVGDFIVVGKEMGTVERIGIKTTRVRALSGEQLVFPNSDLLDSRVQNFRRLQERRVVFTFGVIYETPPELLRQVPQVVREVVEAQGTVRFDRCHLGTLGEYALQFETVYIVLSDQFNTHMDILQRINLGLLERLGAMGVEFAYPTTVEILRRDRPSTHARPPASAGRNRTA